MQLVNFLRLTILIDPDRVMADEDEVDVLGDFNFDNLFSKDDGRL
jgi:hypothetical protein